MKRNIIDIISLSLVCVAVGAVAVANLAQPNRPVISEMENRTLAAMPAFSMESLIDGSYFKGVSAHISDTFLARDRLVSLSKKMDTLKGVEYRPDGEGAFAILSDTPSTPETEDSNDLDDLLNQAFENLDKTETEAPETIPAETEAPETETSETAAPGEDIEYEVRGLSISKSAVRLTVGSGAVVYAVLDTDDPTPDNVQWHISDPAIASISANEEGCINVKGRAVGTCTLSCQYGEEFTAICEVTVTEIVTDPDTQAGVAADFVTSDMFIYGNAVYTDAYFSSSGAESYARTAAYYKNLFGANVRMSVVVAPVSSVVIDNETVKATLSDQKSILERMAALMDPSVNFVDTYTPIYEHRNEYLYFKSDHHWTQRGAYYAYTAFAKSVGLEPTPLEEFDFNICNENYQGSMYMYTQDERVKQFSDQIEVFVSRKPHTMTVTEPNGATITYNSAVATFNKTYVTFIAGDNPYTVINVPENPQDFNILVLKDSFGNAFVPFLCEHYGNIIVVDVRHASFNIYEQLKDYGISDILFVNNVQAANSAAWPKMYLAAVGVG